jgi:hypothetical protein
LARQHHDELRREYKKIIKILFGKIFGKTSNFFVHLHNFGYCGTVSKIERLIRSLLTLCCSDRLCETSMLSNKFALLSLFAVVCLSVILVEGHTTCPESEPVFSFINLQKSQNVLESLSQGTLTDDEKTDILSSISPSLVFLLEVSCEEQNENAISDVLSLEIFASSSFEEPLYTPVVLLTDGERFSVLKSDVNGKQQFCESTDSLPSMNS